jgi:hypothetical protein
MNKLLGITTVFCIVMLSGCTNNRLPIQPIMDSKQFPVLDSGYIAGMFSRDWDPEKLGFGLGIVNIETAEEYVMPFGVETGLPSKVIDKFGMIQLPPGEYRIAYWLAYSTRKKEEIFQTSISPDSIDGLPFSLMPGEVVFIGSYVARIERNNNPDDKTWDVHYQQLTLPSVQKALSKVNPEFATLPLLCPSCLK